MLKFQSKIAEGEDYNQEIEPLTMSDDDPEEDEMNVLTDADKENKEKMDNPENKDNKIKIEEIKYNDDRNIDIGKDRDISTLELAPTIKKQSTASAFDYTKLKKSMSYNFEDLEGERFEFIRPCAIDDKELINAFKKQGINAKNCLIIKNSESFLAHLNTIRDTLCKVLIEIDPLRQQVRRKGFSVEVSKGLINKELFLNTQNKGKDEKGSKLSQLYHIRFLI